MILSGRVLFLLVLLWGWGVAATAIDVPASAQAKLILKIAFMEKNLEASSADPVILGLLDTNGGNPFLRELKNELEKACTQKVSGKTVLVRTYLLGELDKAVADGAKILYFVEVPGNLGDILGKIAAASIISLGREQAWVEGGLTLGVFLEGTTPKIFINQSGASAAKLEFKDELLKLGKVIQ